MNRNQIPDKNEISSEVENIFTFDCSLNAFSCAQIGQSSFNANRIYIKPFSLSPSSMPSFTLFPSSIASSSVNLLFINSCSKIFSLMKSTTMSSIFGSSFILSSNSSGIFNLNSPISITYNNVNFGF